MKWKGGVVHLRSSLVTTIIVILVVLFSSGGVNAMTRSFDEWTLKESGKRYQMFDLFGSQWGVLEFQFVVHQGVPVDVYLIEESEKVNFIEGKDFDVMLSFENVTSVNSSYWFPLQRGTHCTIIVDHSDNPRPEDAQPEGNVTYSLKFHVVNSRMHSLIVFVLVSVSILCIAIPVTIVRSRKNAVREHDH